jgi:tetratricopeptide (TPR) repeat protein
MTVSMSELDTAWALLGEQRFVEALRHASLVLARFPDNVSALACHAMANWKAGGPMERSLVDMRRAVTLAPDNAPLRHNLATLLASHGDIAEAAAEFGEALRLKPDDTLAFYGLTQNSKFAEESDLVRAMLALHASAGLDPQRREFLAYGLAKVFDDLGESERAMGFAVEANRLGARPFDLLGENAAVEEIRRIGERDGFRTARHSGHPTHAPVFIVGMNRSGTTLVESILSRHPDVHALGESSALQDIEAAAFRQAGAAGQGLRRNEIALRMSRDWLSAHAEQLMRQAAVGATAPFRVFTDKLPENAVRLGLISRLLPKAKVVHVRRHPLDVGVSNFFQRFSAGQGFSTRLDWIGARTRQIADSMVLWKRSLDLDILDVSYELLVAEPERQSRRLVAFAGLDWSDACLEPQRTQRSVLTASQWQVRQPIHNRSVARWMRYEPWLGPMIAAMGGPRWIEEETADSSRQGL